MNKLSIVEKEREYPNLGSLRPSAMFQFVEDEQKTMYPKVFVKMRTSAGAFFDIETGIEHEAPSSAFVNPLPIGTQVVLEAGDWRYRLNQAEDKKD